MRCNFFLYILSYTINLASDLLSADNFGSNGKICRLFKEKAAVFFLLRSGI